MSSLFTATTSAKQFSLSAVTDQASDGDFCQSIYVCGLTNQELSLLGTQDNQAYQIKDHTGIFQNGAWPQIYFAPDRYLKFSFGDLNLLSEDIILSSSFTISHQINQVQGSKGTDYDIKLEVSKDNGLNWETISTNIWPTGSGSYSLFQILLPASYFNASSLNNLLTKLSIFGDDGYASLSSILDLVELDIDYYNPQTNTPPTNTINAPSKNQQLKGEFTFDISAIDDFGISKYQLNLLDESNDLITSCLQATITSITSISAACQINTTNYSSGQYGLQIRTKDNAGEWSTVIRSVVFDNTPPVTDLSSLLPQSHTFWKDPISISGASQDNLTTSFVNLYFKKTNTSDPWTDLTTLVSSVTNSIFNWSYSWDPLKNNNPGEGTYDLAVSATDVLGNQENIQMVSEDIAYVPSLFPVIGNQLGQTPAFGEIAISWTTQIPTSGRVVYDLVSHPLIDPSHINYGYIFTSSFINLLPKAITHSLTLTNLSDNTIYYYRIISAGSPTTIGKELTSKTFSLSGSGSGLGQNSPPIITNSLTSNSLLTSFLKRQPEVIQTNQPTIKGIQLFKETTTPTTTTTPPPETRVLGLATTKPNFWIIISTTTGLTLAVVYFAFKKR